MGHCQVFFKDEEGIAAYREDLTSSSLRSLHGVVGKLLTWLNRDCELDPQASQNFCMRLETKVQSTYEPHHEKTNVLVSNLIRHKPDCTAREKG